VLSFVVNSKVHYFSKLCQRLKFTVAQLIALYQFHQKHWTVELEQAALIRRVVQYRLLF